MKNPSLDLIASVTSQKIAQVIGEKVKKDKSVSSSDLENLTTKALGVLQAQGIYAMALFLLSRSGKETSHSNMTVEERCATEIISWLYTLRNPAEIINDFDPEKFQPEIKSSEVNGDKNSLLGEFSNITKNLDTLLLVRNLYEQTLIYARFHAKAAKERHSSSASGGSE